MTAHWRDTATGSELVVGGVVRARILNDDGSLWFWRPPGCAWIRGADAATKPAAQRAAEKALGVNCSEIPNGSPPDAADCACASWGAYHLMGMAGGRMLDTAPNGHRTRCEHADQPPPAYDWSAEASYGTAVPVDDRVWECPACSLRWGADVAACPKHGPGRLVAGHTPSGFREGVDHRPLRTATTAQLHAELRHRHDGLLQAIAEGRPDAAEADLLQRMGWALIGRSNGEPAAQAYGRLLGLISEALTRQGGGDEC